MNISDISCPWGDCPGLNHGPKSREHEGRFVSHKKAESQMVKSSIASTINGDNTRNIAI